MYEEYLLKGAVIDVAVVAEWREHVLEVESQNPPAGATNRDALVIISALLRFVAWLLAAAVTFVTLGPRDVRPHPVFGQHADHALAFLLVGIVFGLAYPQRRWTASVVAVALIGLLEIMQLWVPGRHARFGDFMVDALSLCVGFALLAAADRIMAQFGGDPDQLTRERP